MSFSRVSQYRGEKGIWNLTSPRMRWLLRPVICETQKAPVQKPRRAHRRLAQSISSRRAQTMRFLSSKQRCPREQEWFHQIKRDERRRASVCCCHGNWQRFRSGSQENARPMPLSPPSSSARDDAATQFERSVLFWAPYWNNCVICQQ